MKTPDIKKHIGTKQMYVSLFKKIICNGKNMRKRNLVCHTEKMFLRIKIK